MEIVSGLPLKYLRLESNSSPLNMSQVIVFNRKNNGEACVAPSLNLIKELAFAQLRQIKALRQRLVESPFQFANPVWIDDPHMDIHYHISQSTIDLNASAPEACTQMLKIAASLTATQFDRGSPLWHLKLLTFNDHQEFTLICVAHRGLTLPIAKSLYDALFPANIQSSPLKDIESIPINCHKTNQQAQAGWLPESIPSRNELLKLAKTDWLSLPKQARVFSSMVVSRWAKHKLAKAIVHKSDLPPHWISAPHSIFNQPTGKNRDLAYVALPTQTSRQLLRAYKGFEIRDLVLVLLSRTLKQFLTDIDHHTKDELVALVQCNSLSSEPCQWNEKSLDEYQLLRLPTNAVNPEEQLVSILDRRNTAREYSMLFEKQTDLGLMPSSVLSWLIHNYNKYGIHHFHKPICNLVISEQPPSQGALEFNQYKRVTTAHFASLLPNIGLHVSYWLQNDSACIAFTSGSNEFAAADLAQTFQKSIDQLQQTKRHGTNTRSQR